MSKFPFYINLRKHTKIDIVSNLSLCESSCGKQIEYFHLPFDSGRRIICHKSY